MYAMVDNAHFWRATHFFGEPRFEEPWLSTFDISLGGGLAKSSRNSKSSTTDLLNLYGPHNLKMLGAGIPNKDPNNPLDIILMDLAMLPSGGSFGYVSYDGRFRVLESNIQFTQNFTHGFFVQAQLPIRSMELYNICRCDVSPNPPACPNKNSPEWQAFLTNFNAILKRYCLTVDCPKKNGIGDAAFLVGWTCNHEETEVLDFIDLTFKTGFLAPTGGERNINNPFDIANGYDGHWGFPLVLDTAFGLYEWLNLGIHLDTLMFLDTKKMVAMKTDIAQNGFIKLARDTATIDRGTLWNIGAYLKADHIARGFSFLVGYSYAQQDRTKLSPCNTTIFDYTVVNTDTMLDGFKTHVVHLAAEYDFTKEDSKWGPRIGLFYDIQAGGKRVFKTDMVGGQFGLDISWGI